MEKVIKKCSGTDALDLPLYYVTIENTFDIINRAHIAACHGGLIAWLIVDISRKYANITTKAIELYKFLCEECQKKRPMTKGVVVKPILTKEFSSCDQVDLIDMQSMAQSIYKWIMVYQDHFTVLNSKATHRTKRASEVAFQLMDIFLTLGAPAILQSGLEFTAQVITELKRAWRNLVLVHGKPRHPQSQVSVERANGDIKDMLVAWLANNNTHDWAVGIKFL